jgi:hypothetical protein
MLILVFTTAEVFNLSELYRFYPLPLYMHYYQPEKQQYQIDHKDGW